MLDRISLSVHDVERLGGIILGHLPDDVCMDAPAHEVAQEMVDKINDILSDRRSWSGRFLGASSNPNYGLIHEADLTTLCLCGHRLGRHHCTYHCSECETCNDFRINTTLVDPTTIDRIDVWTKRTRQTWPKDRLWPGGEDPRTAQFVPGRRI